MKLNLKKQKLIITTCSLLAISGGIWLLSLYRKAIAEISYRESNKAVLEKDINDLRVESRKHEEYLDKLRKSTEFQDAVARRELGYAEDGERVIRFPSEENLPKTKVTEESAP